jgi:hypothetical protein
MSILYLDLTNDWNDAVHTTITGISSALSFVSVSYEA